MPRGRLCDDFNRIVEPVSGPMDFVAGNLDAPEIWEDGPQRGYKWLGYCNEPDSVFGVDTVGAYFKRNGNGFDNGVAYINDNDFIIDYPGRIYALIRTNRVTHEELGAVIFTLEFYDQELTDPSTYPDESTTGTGIIFVWFMGDRENYNTNITDGYVFTTSFGDIVPYVGWADTDYWISLDYQPGESVGLRIWTGAWDDEPEEPLEVLQDGGDTLIPRAIHSMRTTFSAQPSSGAADTQMWLRRIGVEKYCMPSADTIITPPDVTDTVIDDFSNRVTSGNQMGTASSGLVYDTTFTLSSTILDINGYLRITTDIETGTAAITGVQLTRDVGYSDPADDLRNYPTWMLEDGIFSFRFRTSAVRTGSRDKTTDIELYNFVYGAVDDNQWVLRVYVSNYNDPVEGGFIVIAGDTSNWNAGTKHTKLDWLENTWYKVEVEQTGNTVRARVYEDGTTPPGWQTTDTVVNAFPWAYEPSGGEFAYLEWRNLEVSDASTPTSIPTLDIDDIRFDSA